MSMERREQLKQTILKYSGPLFNQVNPNLLNDLLALFPAPKREELKELFNGRGFNRYCRNGSETHNSGGQLVDNNPTSHSPNCECRLDEIMAWAIGQPTQEWCKHIVWRDMYPIGWYGREGICFHSTDNFTVCPICGAHRPGEPG